MLQLLGFARWGESASDG